MIISAVTMLICGLAMGYMNPKGEDPRAYVAVLAFIAFSLSWSERVGHLRYLKRLKASKNETK